MINTIEELCQKLNTTPNTLNWYVISRDHKLSEEFIDKHTDKVVWDCISVTQNLSEKFIEKHADKVYWGFISVYQKLSEEFIKKHADKVYWESISACQKLSEDFIEKHADKVNWYVISANQKLSEDFIEKHADKVKWYNISANQKLSEDFIEKHADKVVWVRISACQRLSEDFIEKHADKVRWVYISAFQKLSKICIKKYKLSIPKKSWLYKNYKYKLNYIRKKTDYKIDGDYVIAYKSCRSDGYSKYNFQYHYSVGNTYESHANFNSDIENSFGLSAWTKEGALDYCNQKLFKVKIHINDIACLVHKNNKIRCTKLTIIEEINLH